MNIRNAFKKAFNYLDRDTKSYTLRGLLMGEDLSNNLFVPIVIPFNKGGRMTERAITLGGTAVAAFGLAAAPTVGMLAVTSAVGYAALSKIAGLVAGAFIDTGVNNMRRKLNTPTI